MFTTTTSGVMVKTQLAIHLSLGTLMRLAILKHAQRSESNNKASKAKRKTNQQTIYQGKSIKFNPNRNNRLFKETTKEVENNREKRCIWLQTAREIKG